MVVVAGVAASDASRGDAGDAGPSSSSDGEADDAAPPATRRADGGCRASASLLVVSDATASPPPRASHPTAKRHQRQPLDLFRASLAGFALRAGGHGGTGCDSRSAAQPVEVRQMADLPRPDAVWTARMVARPRAVPLSLSTARDLPPCARGWRACSAGAAPGAQGVLHSATLFWMQS